MNLAVLSMVLFPFAAGAGYYFGGPVLGSFWMGIVLLTCLIIYSSLSRAKT